MMSAKTRATAKSLEKWALNKWVEEIGAWSRGDKTDTCQLCITFFDIPPLACAECPLVKIGRGCILVNSPWWIAHKFGNKAPLLTALEHALIVCMAEDLADDCAKVVRRAVEGAKL